MASVVFSDLHLSDVRHEFIKDRWIKADCLEDKKERKSDRKEIRKE